MGSHSVPEYLSAPPPPLGDRLYDHTLQLLPKYDLMETKPMAFRGVVLAPSFGIDFETDPKSSGGA